MKKLILHYKNELIFIDDTYFVDTEYFDFLYKNDFQILSLPTISMLQHNSEDVKFVKILDTNNCIILTKSFIEYKLHTLIKDEYDFNLKDEYSFFDMSVLKRKYNRISRKYKLNNIYEFSEII